MIEKPVHRRSSLISADRFRDGKGTFWLLPGLLAILAIFVGSTFNTFTATIGGLIFGLLVAGLFMQWSGVRETASSVDRTDTQTTAGRTSASTRAKHALHAMDVERTERRRKRLVTLRKFALLPTGLIVAAGIVAMRVVRHMSGILNPVAMIVDSIAHACLLIMITLWVFYPRRGHPAMLGCGLVVVLTTVTAGGVSHTIQGQLVAALGTVVAFAFAADHILEFWQPDRANRLRRRALAKSMTTMDPAAGGVKSLTPLPNSTVSISSSHGRRPLIYSVLALSILLMSTSAAGHLASRVVPGLQLEFFESLSRQLESVTSNTIIGGTRYVRGSKLGSVRRHMLGDPSEPALNAYSTNPPGYLRGTVFDSYNRGSWGVMSERSRFAPADSAALRSRAIDVELPAQIRIQGTTNSPRNRFEVRKNQDGSLVGTIEVHNVPLKGQLVFTALSTEWIEASTYGVTTLTHHDVVTNGVDTNEAYVLGITSETPREKLEPARKDVMLRLPRGLRETLTPVAESVCEGRLTARAKARAIEEYFQANYTYSLRGTSLPNGADPLVHFLKTQHPAHCEFFASAAAVLLRTQGVPTRYVTGYVVMERSENGRFWRARNRDAHAWVEAYDEITERWFPVEATVGRTYRTLSNQQALIDGLSGSSDGVLDSDDDRTLFGQMVGWLLSFRATDTLTLVFQVAQLPLFCLVVALLWIRQRQKRLANSDPLEFQSRQMLQRADRKLRKHSLVRAPNETLYQFAARMESVANGDQPSATFLQHAAHWYRSFATARYRGMMPEPMDAAG